MRQRRNQRVSSSAKSFAVAMTVVATLAQFFALSHEVTVRHFRCAEHGELTHFAALPAAEAGASTSAAPSAHDGLRNRNLEGGAEHEHCAAVFTVQGGACAVGRSAVRLVVRPPTPIVSSAVTSRSGRDVVLSSAPKTSPPLA